MINSKLPCPEHLQGAKTGRGFGILPALPNRYGEPEDISVYESSNAEYAGIWLRVKGMGEDDESDSRVEATANLTAETAWKLAEQLALLVARHYHGDQRPAPADTVLSIDLDRLELGSDE